MKRELLSQPEIRRRRGRHARPTLAPAVGGVAIGILALLGAGGCQHEDLARERWELRQAHVKNVGDAIARSEASRPGKLRHTSARINQAIATDVERTRQNPSELSDYISRDAARWRQRQPEYRDAIERILRGEPERIEPDAIILFY